MIITIDGPTASGKSTIARILAQKLGCYYIYSGLLFRAIAYILMRDKGYEGAMMVHPHEADIEYALDPQFFEYRYTDGKESAFFHAQDITPFLKNSHIDRAASILSTDAYVRQRVLEYQRFLALNHSVLTDGRDAGSVVFPHAHYKFFVTAADSERARRWRLDQEKTGNLFTQEEAEMQLQERDARDSSRAQAPLVIPHGAVVIDTTGMNKDEVIDAILEKIEVNR